MLRSIKYMTGYNIRATDGYIGVASDFYFDDLRWDIRYLIVDPGAWLSNRQVLISPLAVESLNWETSTISVSLTKAQVEDSPPVETNKPVSRQQEAELHTYYKWPFYWAIPGFVNEDTSGQEENAENKTREEAEEDREDDPHLRSTEEVTGYHIQARDGAIGHVEDFIVDTETWNLNFMVVDTHNLLPGRKVLLAPSWIERVSWAGSEVQVDLTQESIQNSPEYDPAEPVNREYKQKLYDYYGRPHYTSG